MHFQKIFDSRIDGKTGPKFTKMLQNFFIQLQILAPRGTPWAIVLELMYSKAQSVSVSTSDNLCLRYLQPNFIDFVNSVTDKKQ